MADTGVVSTDDPAYAASQRRLAALREVLELNAQALETVREQIRKHPTPAAAKADEQRRRAS